MTFTPVDKVIKIYVFKYYITVNGQNTVNDGAGNDKQLLRYAYHWIFNWKSQEDLTPVDIFSRPTTDGDLSFAAIRIDGHILIDAQQMMH